MASWEELAQTLAADLAFLNRYEFISFATEAGRVQVIQNRDHLSAEVFVSRPLAAQERSWLLAHGWQEPRLGEPTWLLTIRWPLHADAARQLASTLVDATRMFVSSDIGAVEYDARNYQTWSPIELASLRGLRRARDRGTTGGDR